MTTLTQIPVRKTTNSRLAEVDFNHLGFGNYISDHMLVCDYDDPTWGDAQIVPFANLSMNPSTLALHYGQTVFEGMKAFRMEDGRVNIFRLEKHYDRFAVSLERMCMAVPPREMFIEGLLALVRTDADWVPKKPGQALYLRPFVYASESKFGIKVSSQYRFLIFTGPVDELYAKPIRVKVETDFIRAAKGGTGYAKCGGNYGGALYPTQLARKQGYDQLIWTDAKDHRFVEESGAMNLMFVIDDVLITPPLSDSILDGITRDALLSIANEMGVKVYERPIAIDEIEQAFLDRRITEAFGAGTAAVVAPIQTICINGMDMHLPAYNNDSLHAKIKRKLEDIRLGRVDDVYAWNYVI
jgi:branched-chain amino acid aminotransferase